MGYEGIRSSKAGAINDLEDEQACKERTGNANEAHIATEKIYHIFAGGKRRHLYFNGVVFLRCL